MAYVYFHIYGLAGSVIVQAGLHLMPIIAKRYAQNPERRKNVVCVQPMGLADTLF